MVYELSLQMLDRRLPDLVAKFCRDNDVTILGPACTEYGFGWSPTVTYWRGERRLHCYFDCADRREGMTVEVATKGNKVVHSALLTRFAELAELVEAYLVHERSVGELQGFSWELQKSPYDFSIPHPPSADDPANIARLFGK